MPLRAELDRRQIERDRAQRLLGLSQKLLIDLNRGFHDLVPRTWAIECPYHNLHSYGCHLNKFPYCHQ